MSIRQVLLAIGKTLRPHRTRVFLALGFILIHTLLGFALILATSRSQPDLFPLFLVLLFSLHHLLSVFDDWILTDISNYWVKDTRRSCLLHFLGSRKKSSHNSLIDWNELQLEIQWLGDSIFSLLRGAFRKGLQLIVFSTALFWLSPTLFLFCGLLFVVVVILGITMGRWMNRLQEQVLLAQSACSNFELEAARAMTVIRAHRKSSFFSHIHEGFLGEVISKSILLARLRMITHPIQIVLFLSTLLAVYGVGNTQVENGHLAQGHFFAFLAGLSLLHAPLSALSQDISTFLSHREMHHLPEIFSLSSTEQRLPASLPAQQIRGSGLSFEYETGHPVLQDVNFSVQSGQILGFSGNNGSGKTTLTLILAGILPPTEGQISVFPPEADGGPTSFVDQQGTVFTLTLRETLFLGPNEEPSTLQPTFQDSLFQEPPQSLLSPETLSSGQKKLISIERALQQNHQVFIIDEPENSLDYSNQIRLRDLLFQLRSAGKIIILCSHHPLFLDICDEVVNLSKPCQP